MHQARSPLNAAAAALAARNGVVRRRLPAFLPSSTTTSTAASSAFWPADGSKAVISSPSSGTSSGIINPARTLSTAAPLYPDSLAEPEYAEAAGPGSGGARGRRDASDPKPGIEGGNGRTRTAGGGGGGLRRPIYVSATKQHVGKTTTSLALLSGLSKRFPKVGFIKPVGQQHVPVQVPLQLGDCSVGGNYSSTGVPTEEIRVDKDVALVRDYFNLEHCPYRSMSPCLIGAGYTKSYIDGNIRLSEQLAGIERGFHDICARSDVVLCEGTGHCAVGSVVGASNARVASLVGADMVLVANGGLGSTFDELELNRILCLHHGVNIAGVIINKVKNDKYEQTKDYMSRALMKSWGVPLLGCIPDRPYLGCPALADLERLFETEMVSGGRHRFRHYKVSDLNLVTTSLGRFLENLRAKPSRTLYVCHVTRDDIILGFLGEYARRSRNGGEPFESALVVSGRKDKYDVSQEVMDLLCDPRIADDVPVMIARHSTHHAMEMIHGMTPKLNVDDAGRVETAVRHYEPYIDFDLLLERTAGRAAAGAGGDGGDAEGASVSAP